MSGSPKHHTAAAGGSHGFWLGFGFVFIGNFASVDLVLVVRVFFGALAEDVGQATAYGVPIFHGDGFVLEKLRSQRRFVLYIALRTFCRCLFEGCFRYRTFFDHRRQDAAERAAARSIQGVHVAIIFLHELTKETSQALTDLRPTFDFALAPARTELALGIAVREVGLAWSC